MNDAANDMSVASGQRLLQPAERSYSAGNFGLAVGRFGVHWAGSTLCLPSAHRADATKPKRPSRKRSRAAALERGTCTGGGRDADSNHCIDT